MTTLEKYHKNTYLNNNLTNYQTFLFFLFISNNRKFAEYVKEKNGEMQNKVNIVFFYTYVIIYSINCTQILFYQKEKSQTEIKYGKNKRKKLEQYSE